ncbi:MAG TPA: glycosyl hydrolase 53 family protein [Chitinophagaceae bacterium]|nr:glycosyl hydrolase 53 family protein [Chitinophagaceae bacterium]
MRAAICFAVICAVFFSCSKGSSSGNSTVTPPADTTGTTGNTHLQYRGADLSFLPEIEQAGTTFYDSTGAKPALDIFKEYGCNLVRVRLWYAPAGVHSALPEVLDFCKKIHNAGLQILLDFHYSDTWADPGHQATPAAWGGLINSVLQDSVKAYTQRVMGLLQAQNTLPAIVQVGNEVNAGMLWDAGKVNSETDANWPQFTALVKAAIDGIKAVDINNNVLIMLHYAGVDGAADFFTGMNKQNVPYDIIGLSYYAWWAEKDLNYIQQQLNTLTAFNKKIFIAETAYPWTLQWNDNTNNSVGESSQLITAFPATAQGQLNFLLQLKSMLLAIPNKLGIGFCYWAPDWVAFKGSAATDGSSWENLTLFDFSNKALPGMQVYKE